VACNVVVAADVGVCRNEAVPSPVNGSTIVPATPVTVKATDPTLTGPVALVTVAVTVYVSPMRDGSGESVSTVVVAIGGAVVVGVVVGGVVVVTGIVATHVNVSEPSPAAGAAAIVEPEGPALEPAPPPPPGVWMGSSLHRGSVQKM
jgi:hypothetical protein